jgi:hypothetical protein
MNVYRAPQLRIILFALLLLVLYGTAPGLSSPLRPDSEHTLWITIDSTPPGADLFSASAEDGHQRMRIGTTPCIIAADFNWNSQWFKKRWELISVWSPGDICRAELRPDNNYDVSLVLIAVKPGFRKEAVNMKLATLDNPGPDWSHKENWPTERAVMLNLAPTETKNRIEAGQIIRPTTTTLMVSGKEAKEGQLKTGILNIAANVPSAQVYVDDQPAGLTPLQVVLSDGPHVLQLQKQGYQAVRKEINITADTTVSFQAVMKP